MRTCQYFPALGAEGKRPLLKLSGNNQQTGQIESIGKENRMNLSADQLLGLAQYSIVRLDGAWFLALAQRLGKETAWEMDIEAWKQFSYVFGKKIRKEIIPHPVWPESFLDTLILLGKVLKIEDRKINIAGNTITVQTADCEVQRAIAKAGIADCGIATVHTYQGLVRGLFGKEMTVFVRHTKNLNQGDDCCEVVISNQTQK